MANKISNNRLKDKDGDSFFLPDFCHASSVFMVVLVSVLLALILTLVRFQSDIYWQQLGRYSLIILWIAMLSTALLCLSRPVLRRLTDLKAGLASYTLVLIVTLVVSIGGIWIEGRIQGELSMHILKNTVLINNLLLASLLAAIVLRFFFLQAQYRKRIIIAADAKLQALQARIQPHFLFNSMNIIAGLIPTNPVLAEKLIEDLSDLFRASLSEHRSQVSLQSEIDLCKSYLGIEQLRLGERLQCQWQLPEDMDSVNIPPLTLQPLIENAIYHGIQPLVDGGLVSISVTIAKGRCKIMIANPLLANGTRVSEGNNIAVENIRQRLQMLYQERASLEMQIDQQQCVVTLILPCEELSRENTNR